MWICSAGQGTLGERYEREDERIGTPSCHGQSNQKGVKAQVLCSCLAHSIPQPKPHSPSTIHHSTCHPALAQIARFLVSCNIVKLHLLHHSSSASAPWCPYLLAASSCPYLLVVVRKFRLWFDWQTRVGDFGSWTRDPGLFYIHRLGITSSHWQLSTISYTLSQRRGPW